MGPPTMPQPVTPPPTASTAWRLALAAVLLFFCFWVALPVVGVAALLVALAAVGLVSNSLAHVGGYDAGVFAVGLRVGLFALLPGSLILAHRAAYGAYKQGFRRWIPTTFDFGEFVLATSGLLFLAWLTAKLEWDGNPWLPDELATSTGLACLVAFGVGGPVALLVGALALHVGVYEWAVRSANRARGVAIAVGVAAGSLMLLGSLGSQARTSARTASWSPHGLNADEVRKAGEADSFTETSRHLLLAVVASKGSPPGPVGRASSEPAPPPPPGQSGEEQDAAGDRSFSTCLETLQPKFEGVAKSLRSQFRIDIEDARDMAREALIHVCELNAIRPYADLPATYWQAAKNRARDGWRRRKRLECLITRESTTCTAWQEPDEVRLKSEEEALNGILCALSPSAKVALLEWMQGASYVDIGRELGLSETATKDLVNNTLKKVRREMKQKCFVPQGISL